MFILHVYFTSNIKKTHENLKSSQYMY